MTTSLAQALDQVTRHSVNHLRITQAVKDKKIGVATSLLTDRSMAIITDRLVEGDDKGELNPTIDLLREVPGPLMTVALKESAHRTIQMLTLGLHPIR